jgi:hypothetical protein
MLLQSNDAGELVLPPELVQAPPRTAFEVERQGNAVVVQVPPADPESNAARQYDAHQKAIAWLTENRSRYLGQWVALQGDELLASGSTARDVYSRVRGLRPVPLVVQIESEHLPFAGW